jgi:hypothetical protein
MNLEQFKFKPSLSGGVKEEAIQSIGKNCHVKLEKKHTEGHVNVKKVMYNEIVYNVLFTDEAKLKQCLKNIGNKGRKKR